MFKNEEDLRQAAFIMQILGWSNIRVNVDRLYTQKDFERAIKKVESKEEMHMTI